MAIGKFFKNFFSIEIEEEVEPEFYESEEAPSQENKAAKPTPKTEEKPVQRVKQETEVKSSTNRSVSQHRNNQVTDKKPARDERESKKSLMPFSLKGKETSQSKVAEIRRDNRSLSARNGESKEYNVMNNLNNDTKVHLVEPRVFSESQDIADELKRNKATLVNLTRVDNATKKRIIDFLSGTVYALDGDIQKVGQDIFLCSPNNFGVSGEISDQYEQYED
ncbi:cell division protein SepF [Aliicoccus persicus]|uniref:Cell division protein SepF n=1 Tax=Aliicoccus persicus TaxID=930138 RepID=A0A662Z1P9_9STAP|nr:cell division protein SepF [Aliicoccus persicus]SEV80711.1 cell division inhibitor SepF [Aliicoccus persicus]